MGVILAIISILFIIVVHELGHFFMAKALKVPIASFNIGFGPAIWSKQSEKDGVTYAVRAFPLGGYVSFVTDNDTETSDVEQLLVEDSIESAPAWKRILVYAAGPLINIVSGFLIVVILLCTIGTFDTTTLVTEVTAKNEDSAVELVAGDEIIEVNGISVSQGSDVRHIILGDDEHEPLISKQDATVDLTVLRDGEITPVEIDLKQMSFNMTVPENTPLFITDAVVKGFSVSADAVSAVANALYELFARLFQGLGVSDDVGSVVGAASNMNDKFNDIAENFNTISTLDDNSIEAQKAAGEMKSNIWQLCFYVAALSFSLGLFNLIPFPGLDGAKILVAVAEGITRRKINTTVRAVIIVIGFVVLLIFGGWLIARDIIAIAS